MHSISSAQTVCHSSGLLHTTSIEMGIGFRLWGIWGILFSLGQLIYPINPTAPLHVDDGFCNLYRMQT